MTSEFEKNRKKVYVSVDLFNKSLEIITRYAEDDAECKQVVQELRLHIPTTNVRYPSYERFKERCREETKRKKALRKEQLRKYVDEAVCFLKTSGGRCTVSDLKKGIALTNKSSRYWVDKLRPSIEKEGAVFTHNYVKIQEQINDK